MVTKAYQNQYDEFILMAGDGCFVLFETVKHSGPRVHKVILEPVIFLTNYFFKELSGFQA